MPREPAPARPLSPWTYLRRNPRRVAPLLAIQALVTCLLVLIITPTNAFEATAAASVRPLNAFTIVTPRRKFGFDDDLSALLDANPALERRVAAKALWVRTPMIVGYAFAPMIALPQEVWPDFLEKLEIRLAEGSLPEPGTDGVALHEALVRARGMELGDTFGKVVDEKDSTPGRFTLVGILRGPSRVGLIDFGYANDPQSVLARIPPFEVIYATPGRKQESDTYLREVLDEAGERALTVYDAAQARERIDETFERLPLIIGFITGSVAIVVALVVTLLNVIAFQVRVDEFGLYLAVGHRRARLVRKLALETGLVAVTSWLAGLALGLLGVWLYQRLWLQPKGILVEVVDARPLLFSLSVPFFSALTGALALARRLHRMDPVAVIQRRGT